MEPLGYFFANNLSSISSVATSELHDLSQFSDSHIKGIKNASEYGQPNFRQQLLWTKNTYPSLVRVKISTVCQAIIFRKTLILLLLRKLEGHWEKRDPRVPIIVCQFPYPFSDVISKFSTLLLCLGCIPLGWSRSGSAIQGHPDHGTSKEPKDSCPDWIHQFSWCTMIQVILDHWSWSRSSQSNAP